LSEPEIETAAEGICERCLAEVYRYIHFRVYDTELAEELTLKAFRRVLPHYKNDVGQEEKFSFKVFAAAGKEVREHLRGNNRKVTWPGLSPQEMEIVSLKLGAGMDNRRIARILSLSESGISKTFCRCLGKINREE
jgi:DNA-binding NarL/FixJ family response regulator